MNCPEPNTDRLADALAGSERVVIVRGQADSGKTSLALALYEHFAAGEPGCCLMLAPNRPTVQQLRAHLLDRSPGRVLVNPRVMTFDELAGHILLAANVEHRGLSAVHRRIAMRGLINQFAQTGRFRALQGMADTPGLATAVDRSIAEFKRAAVEPDALQSALKASPRPLDKHADLLAVYQAYQQYLAQRNLFDEEGRMWQARLELANAPRPPWQSLRAVIVDGFTDFTPTQLEILALLVARVERLFVTLPHADQPSRAKLWSWTDRQLDRMLRSFARSGSSVRQLTLPDPADGPLDALAALLFAPPGPTIQWPDALRLISASGLESECRAIALWVRGHLAAGEKPDDLAVLARRLDDYQPALARVLADAGLPAPAVNRPLAELPAARLLLELVKIAHEHHHASVLSVLSHHYFQPETLGQFGPDAPILAQLIVRLGNVVSGRDSYSHAAQRLADRIRRRNADPRADDFATPIDRHLQQLGPEAVEQAAALLQAVFDLVAPIAAGGTLPQLAAAARSLLQSLNLTAVAVRHPDDDQAAEDLRAIASLDALLAELEQLADDPIAREKLTPEAFADELRDLLALKTVPAARANATILMAGALDSRALRARHVWLAGLNDGVFPSASADQSLVAEADRRTWAARGLPLDGRDELTSREMLLFYLTVTRAEATLTISWQHSDSAGRARQHSPYLDALLRSIGGLKAAGPRLTSLPPGQFAPPAHEALSPRELLNTALTAAGSPADAPNLSQLIPALDSALRLHPDILHHLAWPLFAMNRRWHNGPADKYDGVLDDASLRHELSQLIPAQRVFSVTQLNTYLTCPWRHFAQWWLNLLPLDDPSDDLLPKNRGLLVHAILRRAMAALAEDGPVATSDLSSPAALAAIDRALQAETAAIGDVPYPALWRNELSQIRRMLHDYFIRQAQSPLPPGRVACMEWSFGFNNNDDPDAPGPLILDGPLGQVRIRGQVDRVDQLQDDGALIIDYKTGALPDVETDLQLPVYLRAVEQLLGRQVAGGAYHTIRLTKNQTEYFARFRLKDGRRVDNPDFEPLLEQAENNIHAAVAGIAAGNFPALPTHKCLGRRCAYRPICGFSPARSRVKDHASSASHEEADE